MPISWGVSYESKHGRLLSWGRKMESPPRLGSPFTKDTAKGKTRFQRSANLPSGGICVREGESGISLLHEADCKSCRLLERVLWSLLFDLKSDVSPPRS